ncbi:MAG: hypothetical protein C0596_08485 [Marinilabiliales bacterium]|nr:MAG: hypothetical protein C0596_08485 [Marinilabiliales bacterium]
MKSKLIVLITILSAVTLCIACNGNAETKNDNDEKDSIVQEEINPLDTFAYTDYNSVARILAGKYPDDSLFLVDVVNSSKFNYHISSFDNTWEDHSKELEKVTAWSNQYLENEDTVFYPFGGPDFNYLDAVFPNCKFTVLIGLEKGGKIPFSDSLSVAQYDKILDMVTHTIVTNVGFSFFRTKSMAVDLAGYLEGTLPIVMMFMSRHGFDVINVNHVFINDNGEFEYTNPDQVWAYTMDKDYQDAYEVIYKKPEEKEYRKLVYMSMDVSDDEINQQTFPLMMQNYFKNQTTFLKAASYLLDRAAFNIVKSYILDNSHKIISVPSGLQFRDVDSTWNVDLYGYYTGPIRLFYDRQQNDLKQAYKDGEPIEIDFLFDYYTGSPSLYVATKKED